jgi:hypothetical protein
MIGKPRPAVVVLFFLIQQKIQNACHALSRWQFMSFEEKAGWIARATWLNSQAVPGKFEAIPINISNSDVAEAMSADLRSFVSLIQNSIT